MVFRAHESHLWMCTSVPQMEVRLTRINTSLGPGRGTGASIRSRPGAAVCLDKARMVVGIIAVVGGTCSNLGAYSSETDLNNHEKTQGREKGSSRKI